jgi:hypothetical protein
VQHRFRLVVGGVAGRHPGGAGRGRDLGQPGVAESAGGRLQVPARGAHVRLAQVEGTPEPRPQLANERGVLVGFPGAEAVVEVRDVQRPGPGGEQRPQ